MADLSGEKNGFRFKGVWWTGEEFSGVLEKVLSVHRAMSNHRIAFHFGVSEKAIRMLRMRSSMADNMIRRAMTSAQLVAGEPAQYSERDWYGNPPADSEARKILAAAESERERQHELRRENGRRRGAGASRKQKAKAQRREGVLCCKQSGLTQVQAAESLACSVRTVRRYW